MQIQLRCFMRKYFGFPLLFLCMLVSACATVDKRIQANADLFSTYSPEDQANIRNGNIALGYTMKMVEIAKGPPSYVNLKKDANGDLTVWRYLRIQQYTHSVPAYDAGIRGARWVDVTETREQEFLRVEFVDGLVTSIEQRQP